MLANLFVASSTSWLKTKFVDVEVNSLNVNSEKLISAITNKTKVILLIHVLGNSTNIEKILKIAKKKNYCNRGYLWSLGSKFKNKSLGTEILEHILFIFLIKLHHEKEA